MQYENRIRVLSRTLRSELRDHANLIDTVLKNLNALEREPADGGVFTDTFSFERETGELVFMGSGGPATRVARYISELYPGKKVRISWKSENYESFGTTVFRSGAKVP